MFLNIGNGKCTFHQGYLQLQWASKNLMAVILMKYPLWWLGHLACMEPYQLPKQILFGELQKKRPSHGTERRWRDMAVADLKPVPVGEDWYHAVQDGRAWQELCRGVAAIVDQHLHGTCAANAPLSYGPAKFLCPCGQSFQQQGDLTRYSCFC